MSDGDLVSRLVEGMDIPAGPSNEDDCVRIKSNVVAFELVTVDDRNIRRVVHTVNAEPAIDARHLGEPIKLWFDLEIEDA